MSWALLLHIVWYTSANSLSRANNYFIKRHASDVNEMITFIITYTLGASAAFQRLNNLPRHILLYVFINEKSHLERSHQLWPPRHVMYHQGRCSAKNESKRKIKEEEAHIDLVYHAKMKVKGHKRALGLAICQTSWRADVRSRYARKPRRTHTHTLYAHIISRI